MAQVTYVPGQMQQFVSNIEFSLNFEDIKGPVKIKIGEIVSYDGTTARYKKISGEEIIGRTSSLRSAITNNWLTLNADGIQMISPVGVKTPIRDPIQYKQPDYNPLTGGGFNEYLQQEVNQGNIASPSNVIRQEDQIVKRTESSTPIPQESTTAKLEVSGDQVSVKQSAATTVSSSTATATPKKAHKTQVLQSEDYGASRTASFKRGTAKQESVQPQNKFTVDDSTPRIADDASLAEIKRATTTIPDERQDGQVVKKIGVKGKMQVQEDGLAGARVVKKIGEIKVTPDDGSTEVEGIRFNKVNPSVEKEGKATVRGSEPIVDLSGVKTQAQVDAIEDQAAKTVGIIEKKGAQNFLDKLPKNWSEMHWVQKEKFIMEQTDKEFVKFILTVEPTKAVQNACRKKLLEIEKASLAKNA